MCITRRWNDDSKVIPIYICSNVHVLLLFAVFYLIFSSLSLSVCIVSSSLFFKCIAFTAFSSPCCFCCWCFIVRSVLNIFSLLFAVLLVFIFMLMFVVSFSFARSLLAVCLVQCATAREYIFSVYFQLLLTWLWLCVQCAKQRTNE